MLVLPKELQQFFCILFVNGNRSPAVTRLVYYDCITFQKLSYCLIISNSRKFPGFLTFNRTIPSNSYTHPILFQIPAHSSGHVNSQINFSKLCQSHMKRIIFYNFFLGKIEQRNSRRTAHLLFQWSDTFRSASMQPNQKKAPIGAESPTHGATFDSNKRPQTAPNRGDIINTGQRPVIKASGMS